MILLLDSDVVIAYLAGDKSAHGFLEKHAGSEIAVSAITVMEVTHGVYANLDVPTANAAFDSFLKVVSVIPVSEEIARSCGQLRHSLQIRGARVRARSLDLIIASTSLVHGCTLATYNESDYVDIDGVHLIRLVFDPPRMNLG